MPNSAKNFGVGAVTPNTGVATFNWLLWDRVKRCTYATGHGPLSLFDPLPPKVKKSRHTVTTIVNIDQN
jgi:hypothetical protein